MGAAAGGGRGRGREEKRAKAMGKDRVASSSSSSASSPPHSPAEPKRWLSPVGFLLLFAAVPVLASLLFKLTDFDAADIPDGYSFDAIEVPKERTHNILKRIDKVGEGLLLGPEDLAYDAKERALYTGCSDGWIRRVKLDHADQSAAALPVEDFAFVGGRPLGVALSPSDGTIVVANAYTGLMSIGRKGGDIKILTQQADGLNFKLTDGVDVSSDGRIYFTDASFKYTLKDFVVDVLELRPHGRVLCFDPQTNETHVLVSNLYFANGVSLSPDQDFIVFCETLMRRCMRYYIKGAKRGVVDSFLENLPGFPDNIRYGGNGSYWIGLSAGKSWIWDLIFKYPFIRKMLYAAMSYIHIPLGDGGIMEVGLEGELLSFHKIPDRYVPTAGLNIGKYLYISSLSNPYIGRVDLTESGSSNQ